MTTAREAPITVRTASDAVRASLTLLGAGLGLLLATAQIAPESEEPVGYIHELLVHPAYRRRGVAMHLLDTAESYFLRDHTFALVMLVTSPENAAALRLYRSRGTRRERDARLREVGVTEEAFARIHGPIGLEIGARTPEEIALAIMARIVAQRHRPPQAREELQAS